jgi:predicted nucleic acid-binding protein
MEVTYFLDTYAIHEMIAGNQRYKKYVYNISLATTQLNLMELYYHLLSRYGLQKAEEQFNNFRGYCVSVDDETIKDAMMFKLSNKRKDLSYVDCVGYTLAVRNRMTFLTGDIQFENMPCVEYVK